MGSKKGIKMEDSKLDELVKLGCIKSYSYINVDGNGVEEKISEFSNSERVKLEFSNGQTLTIYPLCSGGSDNISLFISD